MRQSSRGSSFGRFLAFSTTLHAVIVLAGIVGGAAYQRRAGVELPDATIVFASAEAPEPTSSVVVAEPERPLESPVPDANPEPIPVESAVDAVLPQEPESELLAGDARPASAAGERALDDVLGDPRASWRLPSREVPGLHVGLAEPPHVSDCCGEPQPSQAAGPEVYVYPEVLKMARAEFPRKSQRLGEEGTVLLEMTVGADGLVKGVKVVESSGHPRIDDCAVDAAWDWLFKPATRNGVPEESLARHRYTFRLTGGVG